MNSPQPFRIHSSVDSQIDKLCDEWERLLKEGQQPRLDQYLRQVAAIDQQHLFHELLMVELEYVPANERRALIDRYLGRYSEYTSVLLKTLLRLDGSCSEPWQGGLERVACPHCRAPIDVVSSPVGNADRPLPLDPAADSVALRPRSMQQIGQYCLLDELGSGGFGTVYRAYDKKLERTVAIKVPRAGVLPGPEAQERFLREARSAGRLDHPGIVRVYEVGCDQGRPFIVTEYVDGEPLSLRLRSPGLTNREAVELTIQIADALEHAHVRQVVHRDLKSANILVDKQGRPRLTDFGLAKQESDVITMTMDGKVLGTPGYMSPEQADGGGHHADRRSDIYSLGVLLFELLTEDLPFRGTPAAVLRQVIHDEAPAPSSLCQGIDRDLDTVCLKCLEKSPKARYPTAADMAADLRCWLEGKPVRARPLSWRGKVVRWCQRRPLVSGLLTAIVLLVVGGGSLLFWKWRSARAANEMLVWLQVEAIRTAAPDFVPQLLESIAPYRTGIQDGLHQKLIQPNLPVAVRARLCLVVDEPTVEQIRFLETYSLTAAPDELALIQAVLAKRTSASLPWFHGVLQDEARPAQQRLRAGAMLAALDPASGTWDAMIQDVANLLLAAPSAEVPQWQLAFRPVSAQLRNPLGKAFNNTNDPDLRRQAARILGWMSAEDASALAQLLVDGDPAQFDELLKVAHAAIAEKRLSQVKLLQLLRQWDPSDIERRANQVLALAAWEGPGPIESLLAITEDRSLRTVLIDRLPDVGDPHRLLTMLETSTNSDVRQALLLSFGEMPRERLPEDDWQRVAKLAGDCYEREENGGVHGAAEWVLRKLGKLVALPRTAARTDRTSCGWYDAPNGHTMVRIVPPTVPLPENKTRRTGSVDYSFFVAAHEVTLGQYQKFKPDYRPHGDAVGLLDGPVLETSLAQAAAYCNWLSEQDGLPPDQWCYDNDAFDTAGHFVGNARLLQRAGYRLPTHLEWQIACQAGATTRYSFGNDAKYALKYGWFVENSAGRIQACGLLRPNALGCFDMLGNAMELCPLLAPSGETANNSPNVLYVGGTTSSNFHAIDVQTRLPSLSFVGLPMGGFRLARTVVPSVEGHNE